MKNQGLDYEITLKESLILHASCSLNVGDFLPGEVRHRNTFIEFDAYKNKISKCGPDFLLSTQS